MWKLIKWLFFLSVIALIVLWVSGYKIAGKNISEHVKGIIGAKTYHEGVKDIRSLVGEAIKAVGDAISPEVTPEEQKELENVIKKELEKEGTKSPSQ